MRRLLQGARWVWRHPLGWLLPLAWGLLTWLVHEWTPIAPARHFNLWNANRICDDVDLNTAWDRDKKRHPMVLGVSPDGNTICTVVRTDHQAYWHISANYSGPLRLWDLRKEALKHEWESSEVYLGPNASRNYQPLIRGEWLARRYHIPPKIKGDWRSTVYRTEFVHVRSGRIGPTIDSHHFGVSPNGRWVAHGTWEFRVLDLETETTRAIRCYQVQAPAADGPDVSNDGRLLTVTDSGFVQVIDVERDAIIAKLPVRASKKQRWRDAPGLSPDSEALAWGIGGDVIVSDFPERQPIVIERAKLVGWQSRGRVLVARPDVEFENERSGSWKKTEGVELWDWKTNSCVASWHPTSIDKAAQSRPGWFDYQPAWITQSPCGKVVLFARMVHAEPPSKVRELLSQFFWVPLPPDDYMEVHILDGDSLSKKETLVIPLEVYRISREYYCFHITTDGQYLVFSDSVIVQHWPIRSRSWLRSAGWAGGITLGLAIAVVIRRAWRRSNRNTIAPTAPPPRSA